MDGPLQLHASKFCRDVSSNSRLVWNKCFIKSLENSGPYIFCINLQKRIHPNAMWSAWEVIFTNWSSYLRFHILGIRKTQVNSFAFWGAFCKKKTQCNTVYTFCIRRTYLTPNTPLIHTLFTYSKWNMYLKLTFLA